jgi:mannosyltransferase
MEPSALRRFPILLHWDWKKLLFPAILVGSIAVRLFRLAGQSLWFDETYTALVAGQPVGRMLQYLITDGVHPPLYYAWMAVWIRLFGDSPWSLRLPSVLFGGLSVWLIYLMARRMAGEAVGLLSAFLLGISPFLIWYSQDARMYSMECLAAVSAVFCFWVFLERGNVPTFLGLILSHLFLYGVHYFGLFILFCEALFLLFYWRIYLRRWIPFLIAQAVALVPTAVWGYILLHRANGSFGIGWIPKPVWTDPVLTVLNFFTANGGIWTPVAAVAGIVLVFLYGAALKNSRQRESMSFALIWLIVPIGMAWIFSQEVPLYIDRYFILSLPAAVILAAAGAVSLSGWKGTIPIALLTATMLAELWNVYLPGEGFQKEDWRGAMNSLRSRLQPGDLLLLRVYQEMVPLQYYGMLDREWIAVETNNVVELPEINSDMAVCYFIYWWPAQSAHSFGAPNPRNIDEPNPRVREWMNDTFRLRDAQNRFHGVVILILEPVRN